MNQLNWASSSYLVINIIITEISRRILRLKAPVNDDILKECFLVVNSTFKLKNGKC